MTNTAILVFVALVVAYAEAISKDGICKPKIELISSFFNATRDCNVSSIPDITKMEKAEFAGFDENNEMVEKNVMDSVTTLSTIECLQEKLRYAFKTCFWSAENNCSVGSTDSFSRMICVWREYNAVCEIDDHALEKKNCDYDTKIIVDLLKFLNKIGIVFNQMAEEEKNGTKFSEEDKAVRLCPTFVEFMKEEGCFDEQGDLSKENTLQFFKSNIKNAPNNTEAKDEFLKQVGQCFELHQATPKDRKACGIAFCATGVYDKVCKIKDEAATTV